MNVTGFEATARFSLLLELMTVRLCLLFCITGDNPIDIDEILDTGYSRSITRLSMSHSLAMCFMIGINMINLKDRLINIIIVSSPIERASGNSTYEPPLTYTNHDPRFQSLMPGTWWEGNLYHYLTSWWLTNQPCQFGSGGIRTFALPVVRRMP